MSSGTHPNDLAIGDLLVQATPEAKLIISAYQHDRNHTKNVQAMSAAKFTADNLETCANFLGLKTRDHDNGKIFSNKQTLADRIILKIESLFHSECIACHEMYQNKLADTPLKTCFRCLQGSHDCDQMMAANKALTMPGSVWVCFGCYKQFDVLAPTKEKKSKKEESAAPLEAIPEELQPNQGIENSTPGESSTNNEVPRNERGDASETCGLYMKNSCPHGISGKRKVDGQVCNKDHPKGCLKYLRSGKRGCNKANKNNKCQLFHPVLCRYSVRDRRCTNLQCTFVHLSRTKRWPASNDYTRPDNTRPQGRSAGLARPGQQLRETPADTNEASQQQRPETQEFQPETSLISKLISDIRKDFQTELDQIKKQLGEQQTMPQLIPWQIPLNPTGQSQMHHFPHNAQYPPLPIQQAAQHQQGPQQTQAHHQQIGATFHSQQYVS